MDKPQLKSLDPTTARDLRDFVEDFNASPCLNYADRLIRSLDSFKREGFDIKGYSGVYSRALQIVKKTGNP